MNAARGSDRSRHSRDDVVRAALNLLRARGLADFSMRRLASDLEVVPGALYWHFENKQTLLAALADEIVADALVNARADGPPHTLSAAKALRKGLLATTDGAEVLASTLALGLGGERALSYLSDALLSDGVDVPRARAGAPALLHLMLGHVGHEQQQLQAERLGVPVVTRGWAASLESFVEEMALLIDGISGEISGSEPQRPFGEAPSEDAREVSESAARQRNE